MRRIIGKSKSTNDLLKLLQAIAPDEASVLITGESGTGKELVAQEIHQLSARASYPFIPVNCGAIPAELLESELFGHKKGAFTGAIGDRLGKIQAAHQGTLFLDEIGDMPFSLQAKLLRVLETKTVQKIGSEKLNKIDEDNSLLCCCCCFASALGSFSLGSGFWALGSGLLAVGSGI